MRRVKVYDQPSDQWNPAFCLELKSDKGANMARVKYDLVAPTLTLRLRQLANNVCIAGWSQCKCQGGTQWIDLDNVNVLELSDVSKPLTVPSLLGLAELYR